VIESITTDGCARHRSRNSRPRRGPGDQPRTCGTQRPGD
jgi:hypothetical protein